MHLQKTFASHYYLTITSYLRWPFSENQLEDHKEQPFAIDASDIGLLLSPQLSLLEFHGAYKSRLHYIDIIKGSGLGAGVNSTVELKYTGMSDKSQEVWGRPKNFVCSRLYIFNMTPLIRVPP